MSGNHSRTKGHNFERWVARILREVYPSAKRGLQSRAGSASVPDVEYTPWWIECKRLKVWRYSAITAAFRQAEKARALAGDARPILVIFKEDNGSAYVFATPDLSVALVEFVYRRLTYEEAWGAWLEGST